MMTAKEKQFEVIKSYLKPTLRSWGYKTSGQNWWKEKSDLYIVIKLQNFSWNTKDKVDFCFNTGITFKAQHEKTQHKFPGQYNLAVHLRSGFFLPENRKTDTFQNGNGYHLSDQTNLDNFIQEMKLDFEEYILPYLEKINTIDDSLAAFGELPFWGENMKRILTESGLL